MNDRVTVPIDSLDLLKIERWINAGIPEMCENFCITDEVVTTTLSNASYHFGVDNILTASNSVINGSDITYEAGERTTLNTGFNVDAVSDFHAFIGACN